VVDLRVKIGNLTLANPVMPGSGTFAEGMTRAIDCNALGAIVTKTITLDVREGNPPPRLIEFPDAVMGSIGIPSKGVDYYVNEIVPFYRDYAAPLIASISADTVEDFGELARRVSVPGVVAIEANVSCPNLRKHGLSFGLDAQATGDVVRAMKAASPLPVWLKVTPNAGQEVVNVALAAEEAGADAIIVANALLAMTIDVETRRSKLGTLMGGIIGPAMRPIIVRMAYQVAQAVSIPIIASGGIMNATDALEFILAGASAVQIGTATFLSANSMIQIIQGLQAYCERHGVERISDLIGALRTGATEGLTTSAESLALAPAL